MDSGTAEAWGVLAVVAERHDDSVRRRGVHPTTPSWFSSDIADENDGTFPLSLIWKTQMNENGKVPAFWSAMSELNHNEVVGWTAPYGERFFVVALRHDGEDPQMPPRFPLSYDIVRTAGVEVEEVHARGTSSLARLLSLIIVGDLASVYLAINRGVDPTPVPVIERLKAALAGS